jgi:flagellar protein FlbD
MGVEVFMIKVTKLNGEVFYVNPYEIEFIEETPDTVISLKSGRKVLVSQKADDVINKMIDFYRLANQLPKVTNIESAEEVSLED